MSRSGRGAGVLPALARLLRTGCLGWLCAAGIGRSEKLELSR